MASKSKADSEVSAAVEAGIRGGREFSAVYCGPDANGGVLSMSMTWILFLPLIMLSKGLGMVGVCRLSDVEAVGGGWICAFVDKLSP